MTGVAIGATTITVTATDVDGSNTSASQTFEAEVVNRPPQPVGRLTGPELQVGEGEETLEVSNAFQDPDGDMLIYVAWSESPWRASVAISGSLLTLTPVGPGTATITVTAVDIAGSNAPAKQTFRVSVKARRGVTISRDALTVGEGATGSYTVVLDSEPTGPVTVTPTAPANTDVSVDPTELTFTTGDWSSPKTVLVAAARDPDMVGDAPVTISHQVRGSDYGSAPASSVEVTIVEADASTLAVEAAEGSENDGTVVFRVTLSKASSSEVTVDYATSDGSGSAGARAGSDYTAASGTLTFPVGSTTARQIVVDVADDREDEEEAETFHLTLRSSRHASLVGGGSTLQVTGTIRDDDDPEVELSFGSANYELREGGTVTVVVRLNRDPERTETVLLKRTHHGGATIRDYSGVPWSVSFGPGVTTRELLLVGTDDANHDDGEAVALGFWQLTGAISDDDDGGGVQPPPPPAPSGPPEADFTLTAECAEDLCRARTGLPVTFEDTSTGRVQSRRWDFGDGTGSRNRRVDQVWSSPGFYEVTLTVSDGTTVSTASEVFLVESSDPAGTCESSAERRCLQDSRYAIAVEWLKPDGESGPGSVVHAGANDSGLFLFFDPENWEVLIKVLDGCALNDHVWVFGASTTDLGYTIQVTDTATGAVKEYRNEPGRPAAAITDGTAFPEGCRP